MNHKYSLIFLGSVTYLISRGVRRTFLCGKDPETNKDYEYRRLWIENKILELADYFSIEVFSYAVMHRLFLLQSRHTVHSWT
jgi:putative transposase